MAVHDVERLATEFGVSLEKTSPEHYLAGAEDRYTHYVHRGETTIAMWFIDGRLSAFSRESMLPGSPHYTAPVKVSLCETAFSATAASHESSPDLLTRASM
jgi:hypothetical protein